MKIAELKEKAKKLPKRPGVYLMKSSKGEVLYVGKASDLRSRVGSYFSKEGESRYQIRFLMSKVNELDTILTDNAKEALLLENTLIKKHRPRYNIDLKDDKSYVSLKLSIQDPAPRLYVTRRIRKDGSLYFGPYASAGSCREVVDFIQTHFRLRTCSDHDYRNRVRPCLQYQIKRCDAPCVEKISLEDYGRIIDRVRLFLEGRNDELMKLARREMESASETERFEEAAGYRDLLTDMEKTLERQKVVSHQEINQDVLGLFREGEQVLIYMMIIREGNLQESRPFLLKSYEEDPELLSSFLTQYYEEGRVFPRQILTPQKLEDEKNLEEILKERAGARVEITYPQRGSNASLLALADKNAAQAYQQRMEEAKSQDKILEQLQKNLKLKNLPRRLECYDISNFQGRESMGSMVTFLRGKAVPKLYRHFKIKTVEGSNDFASLYEVLDRRIGRAQQEDNDSPEAPWQLPDLIVIDGGKGQLNAAAQALKDRNITGVDIISLAKSRIQSDTRERSEERVFILGKKDPVHFPQNSPVLFLLVQARDEAHRFGIESHRKWRNRRTLFSALDNVEGVGKVRRQKLMKHFGSLKNIKAADPAEISKLLGGPLELGARIKESL